MVRDCGDDGGEDDGGGDGGGTSGADDRLSRSEGTAYIPGDGNGPLLEQSDDLTAWLSEQYGDALRTVIVYRDDVSEYVYLSNRVRSDYTTADLERIAGETAFRDALTNPHYESLFNLGETAATATLFADATLVQVPFDESTGVLITVDREVAVDVDRLTTALREAHRPTFLE